MKNPDKICLECRHCYVDGGHPGYSEYTPSSPFEFGCSKGYNIGYHRHDTTKESLLKGIQQAADCPDFLEEKQKKKPRLP